MQKLSIIIPVFNEKKTIGEILKKVEAVEIPLDKEIIIVDDLSTDGTREILKEYKNPEAKIIFKEKNEGKGSSVKRGLLECTGDFAIIQDADLEYDPEDYNTLLEPALSQKANVVFGSRFMGDKPHRVLYFWHSLGNKILTIFSNMFTNLNLTDMEAGYKLLDRKTIEIVKEKLTSKKFGIEPEITAIVAKNKLKIYEVGISYSGRTYEEGKKIGWRDGIAAFYHILRSNLRN